MASSLLWRCCAWRIAGTADDPQNLTPLTEGCCASDAMGNSEQLSLAEVLVRVPCFIELEVAVRFCYHYLLVMLTGVLDDWLIWYHSRTS